jgi:pimeloyl-ACP methyl ester carboxylesterase
MQGRWRVVLIPGLLCDRWVWGPQAKALGKVAEVVIADVSDAATITDMAEAALARAPGKIALAGHSLGGRIALEAVRLAPDRIERLALLDTGVGPIKPEEEASRMQLVRIAHEQGMDAVADAWLPPMVWERNHADATLMQGLRAMIRRSSPERFERQQRALLSRPDARPGLADIVCPTLVMTGRYDSWAPVSQHEEIAAKIPVSRLEVVEGAGHMSTVERPAAVNELLLAWLEMRVGG